MNTKKILSLLLAHGTVAIACSLLQPNYNMLAACAMLLNGVLCFLLVWRQLWAENALPARQLNTVVAVALLATVAAICEPALGIGSLYSQTLLRIVIIFAAALWMLARVRMAPLAVFALLVAPYTVLMLGVGAPLHTMPWIFTGVVGFAGALWTSRAAFKPLPVVGVAVAFLALSFIAYPNYINALNSRSHTTAARLLRQPLTDASGQAFSLKDLKQDVIVLAVYDDQVNNEWSALHAMMGIQRLEASDPRSSLFAGAIHLPGGNGFAHTRDYSTGDLPLLRAASGQGFLGLVGNGEPTIVVLNKQREVVYCGELQWSRLVANNFRSVLNRARG